MNKDARDDMTDETGEEKGACGRLKEPPPKPSSGTKRDVSGRTTHANLITVIWTFLTQALTGRRQEDDLNWRLHQACVAGDVSVARHLLLLGANPDMRFPAHLRTTKEVIGERENDIITVRNKFNGGVPKKEPRWCATSLFVACEKQDLLLVDTLLEFGANPDFLCGRRRFFSVSAILKTVKKLRNGAHSSCTKSTSPIVTACCLRNVALLEKLLLAGGSVDVPDHCRRTGLGADQLYLCEEGQNFDQARRIISLLLKYGADVNKGCNADALTPIQLACKHSNFEMTKYLIDQGAEIVEQGHHSCLQYACNNASPVLLEYLLDRGARPGPTEVFSIPTSELGRSVCSVLAKKGYPELVLEWSLRNMQLRFLSVILEAPVYIEPKLLRLAATMDKSKAARSWILLARAGMQGQHALDALSKFSDLQESLPLLEFCELLHPHFIFKHTEMDARTLVTNTLSPLKFVSTPKDDESEEDSLPTTAFASPPTLVSLCVIETRRHIVTLSDGKSILPQIASLPLPKLIKSYLRHDHILNGIDFLDTPLPELIQRRTSSHGDDQKLNAILAPDTFVICAMLFLGFMVLLHHVSRYYRFLREEGSHVS